MQRELRIGDVASRSGRSVHAIRWYEAQGLLPGVVRDAAGRRIYSDYHIGWLDLLDRLRQTGMPIREMRQYTTLAKQGEAAIAQRRALIGEHQRRVRDSIARWTDALALINAKVEFYDEWIASGERPAVSPHQRLPRAMRALKKAARA
jgi:DNA-binding transcriptional MerR regulator